MKTGNNIFKDALQLLLFFGRYSRWKHSVFRKYGIPGPPPTPFFGVSLRYNREVRVKYGVGKVVKWGCSFYSNGQQTFMHIFYYFKLWYDMGYWWYVMHEILMQYYEIFMLCYKKWRKWLNKGMLWDLDRNAFVHKRVLNISK